MRIPNLVCLILLLIATTTRQAGAAELTTSSNMMTGFNYISCSSVKCIEIKAPQAWMSLVGGGFTTGGPTTVNLIERSGHLLQTQAGLVATYNPVLHLITLDLPNGDFAMYSTTDFDHEKKAAQK
jgi:hypothetical protein